MLLDWIECKSAQHTWWNAWIPNSNFRCKVVQIESAIGPAFNFMLLKGQDLVKSHFFHCADFAAVKQSANSLLRELIGTYITTQVNMIAELQSVAGLLGD